MRFAESICFDKFIHCVHNSMRFAPSYSASYRFTVPSRYNLSPLRNFAFFLGRPESSSNITYHAYAHTCARSGHLIIVTPRCFDRLRRFFIYFFISVIFLFVRHACIMHSIFYGVYSLLLCIIHGSPIYDIVL